MKLLSLLFGSTEYRSAAAEDVSRSRPRIDGLGKADQPGLDSSPRKRLGYHAVLHPELGLPAHVHKDVPLQLLAFPFARVGPDRPPPVLPRRPQLLLPEYPSLFR